MSQPEYLVFGESKLNTKSIYTYANALTVDIMDRLGNDKRFLDCNQADILNLALVILYGFVSPEEHNNVSKGKLHEFVENYTNFKDFAMLTINTCRLNNVKYNDMLDEVFEDKNTQKVYD